MSKMRCHCGHWISNTVTPCPTEGWLVGEVDDYRFHDEFPREVASLIAAIQEGRRDEWVREHISAEYPTEGPDHNADLVHALLLIKAIGLSVAECEKCGRLWIQGRSRYRSYVPDTPGYAGILRCTRVDDLPDDAADNQ